MATGTTHLTEADLDRLADEYADRQTWENIVESLPQGRQRAITLASLEALQAYRPEVAVFNEMLLQVDVGGDVLQAVPDNFVVLSPREDPRRRAYRVPPDKPLLWAIEYVSQRERDRKKDYEASFQKYEQIGIPYCLMIDFGPPRMSLFRHTGHAYEPVLPDARMRLAIPELSLELAVLNGWVRFWHRGELLPITVEAVLRTIQQEAALREKESVIDEQSTLMASKDEQISLLTRQTRESISRLAGSRGRQDILTALNDASPEHLAAWLAELTP